MHWGRGLDYYDVEAVDGIVDRLDEGDGQFIRSEWESSSRRRSSRRTESARRMADAMPMKQQADGNPTRQPDNRSIRNRADRVSRTSSQQMEPQPPAFPARVGRVHGACRRSNRWPAPVMAAAETTPRPRGDHRHRRAAAHGLRLLPQRRDPSANWWPTGEGKRLQPRQDHAAAGDAASDQIQVLGGLDHHNATPARTAPATTPAPAARS